MDNGASPLMQNAQNTYINLEGGGGLVWERMDNGAPRLMQNEQKEWTLGGGKVLIGGVWTMRFPTHATCKQVHGNLKVASGCL